MTACMCLAPTAQSASCLTSTAVRSPFLSWPSRPQYARSCTAQRSSIEQHSARYLLFTVLQSVLAKTVCSTSRRSRILDTLAALCRLSSAPCMKQSTRHKTQLISLLEMTPSRKHIQRLGLQKRCSARVCGHRSSIPHPDSTACRKLQCLSTTQAMPTPLTSSKANSLAT